MPDLQEYLNACQERRNFLTQQLVWLKQEDQAHQADAAQLNSVLERIRQETVGYLLPDVQDSYLSSLEKKIEYPGLMKIKQEYDAKFRKAEIRLAELKASDEIHFFDVHFQRAKDAVDDIFPAYESLRRRVETWEKSPSFQRLQRRGFFELDAKISLWSRFLNWRDVSFLMSHLASKLTENYETPKEVKDHYRLLRNQADDVFAAYQSRTAERDRLLGLQQEVDQLTAAPERLLSQLYRDLGNAVLEHLQACPDDVRIQLAREDSFLDTFFRKELGTRKQIQYLKELLVTRVANPVQQVEQEIAKLDTKIQKLTVQKRRGKRKSYTYDQVSQMRDFKADKWVKRRARLGEVRERIVTFDRHDRGSFLETYLWWDLMTRGAAGDDIFEVRQFHEHHPNWSHKDYEDPIHTADTGEPLDDAAESLAASMSTPGDDAFQDAT